MHVTEQRRVHLVTVMRQTLVFLCKDVKSFAVHKYTRYASPRIRFY
jgi:hypothetical protein